MKYSLVKNFSISPLCLGVASALLLSACGGGDTGGGSSGTQGKANPPSAESQAGKVVGTPKVVGTFTSADLAQALAKVNPIGVASMPTGVCDVKVEKFTYNTIGAQGEGGTATAALMLPTGTDAKCQGKRPIVLYAHGTATEKNYDLSQVGTENPASPRATEVAAQFAAMGYIVVAPNYIGYDESSFDYHPYLNANVQSKQMTHALAGARDLLQQEATLADNQQLFITGYSEGGHVAMATARRLQFDGKKVDALVASSGPYAMGAFGDMIFSGKVNLGSTAFAPLLAKSYEKSHQLNPQEIFETQYGDVADLLPSDGGFETLVQAGKLPQTALLQKTTGLATLDKLTADNSTNPVFALGFADQNYLVKTSYRAQYLQDSQANPDGLVKRVQTNDDTINPIPASNPQNVLRKALKDNDLRLYAPSMPTLLCGGHQDPMVFFDVNTKSVAGILGNMAQGGLKVNLTTVNVDQTDSNRQDLVSYVGSAQDLQTSLDSAVKKASLTFANTVQALSQKALSDASVQATLKMAYDKAYEAAFAATQNEDQAKQIAEAKKAEVAQLLAKPAVIKSYHGSLVASSCTGLAREYFEQFS